MLSKTHLKFIQSLHLKKNRDAARVFIAEGNKVVAELLRANHFLCREIWATPEWVQSHQDHLSADHLQKLRTLSANELKKISQLQSPGEVMAIFNQSTPVPVTHLSGITLFLDTIQDPGNLGTMIRIADWFGVHHVICTRGCVDVYNSKVIQSSMGSMARVEVVYVDGQEWLAQWSDIPKFAATLNGEKITGQHRVSDCILMIGNESKGLHPAFLQMANACLTIPRLGQAESLNAAVAAGILLSHLTPESNAH